MVNIRIVRLSVKSNTQLVITFTANLSTAIDSTNIKIEGVGGTTPNLIITSTSVSNKEFTINILPMIRDRKSVV